MAVPRIANASPVSLPQPLPPSDAGRLRRIFALQAKSDIPAALAECAELSDHTLLGHVLADRYLGAATPQTRPQAGELVSWLAEYGTEPDAAAIQALLATLPGQDLNPAAKPPPIYAVPTMPAGDDMEPVDKLMARNPGLDRSVRDAARAGQADRAIRLVARTRGIDRLYGAQLRAEVAQILFTQGRDTEALSLAEAAHTQARGQVGLAPYVAGLAAWRLDRPELARTLFEAAYRAALIQPGQRAGAAFWAARAQLSGRTPSAFAPWMQRAAQNPRTFYGLLARRSLGQPVLTTAAFSQATLGEADVEAIEATPSGHRAFALLQVGQSARAASELRLLWSQTRISPALHARSCWWRGPPG